MTKGGISAVAIASLLLCGACDREKQRPGQPGAVGTAGHGAMTVRDALSARAPAFVSNDAEGARRWKLTRQFYQNRSDAPAWIENRKPRSQMDDLIRALQGAEREGLDPALYNLSMLT